MGENENKNESKHCCCCQSWKALFIAIAFMAIGAVFGHMMTMMHLRCCGHHNMMGPCGGYGMGECRERGERECEGRFEHKFQCEKEGYGEREEKSCEYKGEMGKCPKKAACVSEPNKTSCPMMDKDKKEGKSKKD
jgi:hypothetical protein